MLVLFSDLLANFLNVVDGMVVDMINIITCNFVFASRGCSKHSYIIDGLAQLGYRQALQTTQYFSTTWRIWNYVCPLCKVSEPGTVPTTRCRLINGVLCSIPEKKLLSCVVDWELVLTNYAEHPEYQYLQFMQYLNWFPSFFLLCAITFVSAVRAEQLVITKISVCLFISNIASETLKTKHNYERNLSNDLKWNNVQETLACKRSFWSKTQGYRMWWSEQGTV